jgi:hypothetical protein
MERSITLSFSGIPATRINQSPTQPQSQPQPQAMNVNGFKERAGREQLNSARRPQSTGKPADRSFTHEPALVGYPGLSHLDRNIQSQANVIPPRYQQGQIPVQPSTPRKNPQSFVGNYLNGIESRQGQDLNPGMRGMLPDQGKKT